MSQMGNSKKTSSKSRIRQCSDDDDDSGPFDSVSDRRDSFSPSSRRRTKRSRQQRLQRDLEDSDNSDDASELQVVASRPTPPEDNLKIKAMKAIGAMDEGDGLFGTSDEINLDLEVYWWHDKYRPRKPKYLNHVHTGYEWNKYNRTHFDHNNPPPKFVQGYKFNIFYPDLVDKTKAPVYTIEKDGDSVETCIIRFHAGPPYEDIAFRIVNKEWEYSQKKGFKCTYERGILHIYFNFKRHQYRR